MAVAPPLLDKATFKIFHSVNKRVEIVNIFFFFKNLGFLLFLPFDIFSICILPPPYRESTNWTLFFTKRIGHVKLHYSLILSLS